MAKDDSTAVKRGLSAEEVRMVRNVLLIGLASYGEIQRLQNVVDLCKATGEHMPGRMHPIDPTGSAETVCDFADALRSMEHAEAAHG